MGDNISKPFCISKLARITIREINNTDIFLATLNSTNHPHPYGLVAAHSLLFKYLSAAKIQFRRINKARNNLFIPTFKTFQGELLFQEIHFYTISRATIYKLARFLQTETRFERAGVVMRHFKNDFEKAKIAREFYEHIDERCKGLKKTGRSKSKLNNPLNFLNIFNQQLTFDDNKLDIGPNSILALNNFSKQFKTAILYDSCETLFQESPIEFTNIIRRAEKAVQIKKMQRIFNQGQ